MTNTKVSKSSCLLFVFAVGVGELVVTDDSDRFDPPPPPQTRKRERYILRVPTRTSFGNLCFLRSSLRYSQMAIMPKSTTCDRHRVTSISRARAAGLWSFNTRMRVSLYGGVERHGDITKLGCVQLLTSRQDTVKNTKTRCFQGCNVRTANNGNLRSSQHEKEKICQRSQSPRLLSG